MDKHWAVRIAWWLLGGSIATVVGATVGSILDSSVVGAVTAVMISLYFGMMTEDQIRR